MTTRITDSMILAAGGVFSIEAVSKVRRILSEAGISDVELHRLEIEALRKQGEVARSAKAAVDRYLASGPLPDHSCVVDDAGIVMDAGSCPFACRPKGPRLVVEQQS